MKLGLMKKVLMLLALFVAVLALSSCGSTQEEDNVGVSGKPENVKQVDEHVNPNMVGGKTKTIEAEGMESISAVGGVPAARDRAIQDANQKAIKQVVGMVISSEKLVEDNELISSTIKAETTGYILGYDIISEGEDGDLYKVKVKAEVGMDKIEKNVKAVKNFLQARGYPRIVVLVDENAENQAGESWETGSFMTSLEKYMMSRHFTFVDKNVIKSVLAKENVRFSELAGSSVSPELATKLAGAGAEYIIQGTATANWFMDIRSMKSYRGTASIKVIDASTAEIIASTSDTPQQGQVGGTDKDSAAKALSWLVTRQEGGKEAGVGPDIVKAILESWSEDYHKGMKNVLLLTGLDFGSYITFKNGLMENFRDAKEIIPKGQVGDRYKIIVRWNGTAQSLAEQLYIQANKIGFDVEIKNVNGSVVAAVVTPKGGSADGGGM